jgi:predicted transcriptional regulator of viral defense system
MDIDKYRGFGTFLVMETSMGRLLELARKQSVIRPRDLTEQVIPHNYLGRLVRAGKLEKVGRGIYSSPEVPATEHRTLLEVCEKVPQAVICLASALLFHELTTENPFEVWTALQPGVWTPRSGYPPIRTVRFSGESFTFGIEKHSVEGGKIRVYTPAKTVADCFKFRSKVGTELAIQALRECLREKKASMDDLWKAAKVCRVANIMRPYMESLS